MKKVLALVLSLVLVVGVVATLAACGGKDDAPQSDFEYIQEKGELVIGITYFAPMNYFDENNELVGFETEFAKAVCEKLGVEAKFQEISWSAKETELAGKSIDCIWNGMTITAERQEAMDISTPYLANKQVLVVKADKLAEIKALTSGKGLNVVAEKESAGEEVASTDAFFADPDAIKTTYVITAVDTQSKAFTEVASGIADACVVDYVCSIGMIGEGTDFENLVVVDTLNFADEQYGIAFRKGSDVDDKVNAAITELVNDGTLANIATKYKLEEQVIAK